MDNHRDVVLVVDDSPEFLNFLTDALEDGSRMVLVALSGNSALRLVDRVRPDIVLMDALMPGMDGFETCRRLKASEMFVDVPVIFMTGLSDTEHVLRGFEAGGVDYVVKPVVPDELMARMQRHLTNARKAYRAREALDAAGRFLVAVDFNGRITWSTPHAAQLIAPEAAGEGRGAFVFADKVAGWLRSLPERTSPAPPLKLNIGERLLHVSYVGPFGPGEALLRIRGEEIEDEIQLLHQRLPLSPREAQVLLWVRHGKSNREIAAILNISHRTINKHLDQIYAKLGVENRTAATATVLKALGAH